MEGEAYSDDFEVSPYVRRNIGGDRYLHSGGGENAYPRSRTHGLSLNRFCILQ
jgi:hypothetical protein